MVKGVPFWDAFTSQMEWTCFDFKTVKTLRILKATRLWREAYVLAASSFISIQRHWLKHHRVTQHSDKDVGGKAASEWRKERKLLMECDGMCLYHVIEGGGVGMGCTVCVPRSRNCCDRLWGSDSWICLSQLSVGARRFCANELAGSRGQTSPVSRLKITFIAFAELIQAHKKWELHRRGPLLLLLLCSF